MTVLRVQRTQPGAYVPRDTAHDLSLSIEALGLLTWLLAHGDGWEIRFWALVVELRKRRTARRVGRDYVRRLLQELQKAGYVRRYRTRGADGRWQWVSIISDTPIPDDYDDTDGSAIDGSAGDGSAGDGPTGDGSTGDIRTRESRTRESRTGDRHRPARERVRDDGPPADDDLHSRDDVAPAARVPDRPADSRPTTSAEEHEVAARVAAALARGGVRNPRAYIARALRGADLPCTDAEIDRVLASASERTEAERIVREYDHPNEWLALAELANVPRAEARRRSRDSLAAAILGAGLQPPAAHSS